MHRIVCAAAAGLFLLFLLGGLAFGLSVGDKAPQLSGLTDLEGRPIEAEQFTGRPVFLSFWTSWCPQCKTNFARVDDLHTKYHQLGLEFLAVNAGYGDSLKRARAIQERFNPQFPMAYDHKSQVSKEYGIRGVPVYFLLDAEGTVVLVEYAISDQLVDKIEEMMGRENHTTARSRALAVAKLRQFFWLDSQKAVQIP